MRRKKSMTLELCEKHEYTLERGERKPWFVAREGRIFEQGAQLLREGYTIGSAALILERRLHSKKKDWQDYFDSADLFVYHCDGRVKYVLDGLACLEMLSRLPVQDRVFIGDDSLYDGLLGREWARNMELFDRELSVKERQNHDVWDTAARERQLFLDYSARFHRNEEAMGVFLAIIPLQTSIRAACVYRLVGRSQFNGRYHLDGGNRRLVGLAPEALEVLAEKYPEYASAFVSHASEVKAGLERYFAAVGSITLARITSEQGSGRAENVVSSKVNPHPSIYAFDAPIPLEPYTIGELATLEAEQKAAQETQQTQWTRAFEINSEMKKR